MKKINIFKINCQKIKILKIKHGATEGAAAPHKKCSCGGCRAANLKKETNRVTRKSK